MLKMFTQFLLLFLYLLVAMQCQHIQPNWLPTDRDSKLSRFLPMNSIQSSYPNQLLPVLHNHPSSSTSALYVSPTNNPYYSSHYSRYPLSINSMIGDSRHVNGPHLHTSSQHPSSSFRPVSIQSTINANPAHRDFHQSSNQDNFHPPISSINVHKSPSYPHSSTSGHSHSYSSHSSPSASFSSSCWIHYEGMKLDCYSPSSLYQDKLLQLKHRGMLSHEHVNEQYNSCDFEQLSEEFQTARRRRKRRAYTFTILKKGNSTQSISSSSPLSSSASASASASTLSSFPLLNQTRSDNSLLGLHSHSYPREYPILYSNLALPHSNEKSKKDLIEGQADTISVEQPDVCFLNFGLSVRKPYHLYNSFGQVRFVVQEEQMQLTQCQPKATCGFMNYEPIPLKSDCNEASDSILKLSGRFHCDRRLCTHQLLSFDPSDLTKFIFYDEFPFECCCRCQIKPLQHSSQCHLHLQAPPK